jgi:hypothetical protein
VMGGSWSHLVVILLQRKCLAPSLVPDHSGFVFNCLGDNGPDHLALHPSYFLASGS